MDELQEAWKKKYKEIKVAGADVTIRKWPFQAGLQHSAALVDILRGFKVDKAEDLLKIDLTTIVTKHGGTIRSMLVDSVQAVKCVPGSGDPAPKAWIDDLSLDEMVPLLKEVVVLNFLPLARMADEAKGAINALRALRPSQT